MIKEITTLLNLDIRDILKSPELSLLLKNTYSNLYLGGGVCGGCSSSLQNYYRKIYLTGIETLNKREMAKNRTLIPNWKGNRYFRSLMKHVNSEIITDEQAADWLERGLLKKADFKKLPQEVIAKKQKAEKEQEKAEKEQEKAEKEAKEELEKEQEKAEKEAKEELEKEQEKAEKAKEEEIPTLEKHVGNITETKKKEPKK